MNRKLEDVLDECLERMLRGESIEDCLNAYPEQAPELEPLLKTSLDLMQGTSAIPLSREFKTTARSQLGTMLHDRQGREAKKAGVSVWHRKWAVAAATILVIVFCGVGTVAASANALPGEPLYPIKLAAEQVRVTLAFSDIDRAELHIQYAERRAAEIEQMANQGEADKISEFKLTERLDKHLQMLAHEVQEMKRESPGPLSTDKFGISGNAGQLEDLLGNSTIKARLGNALDKVPPSVRPQLQQAIEDYDKAVLELGDD